MTYQLTESNEEDYVSNAKDYLEDKEKIISLEAELKLLRDWRDTWINERDRLHAQNEMLRQTLAKIADEARKVVFNVLLNK